MLTSIITFVLPLYGYRDINLFETILLPSLEQFYKGKYKVLILVNYKFLNLFTFENDNITIISETEIYETNNNSYYYQMLLKLYVAKIIKTDYYITLDADVIFTKDCNINNFIMDNKCCYQKIIKRDKWSNRVEQYLDISMNFITNQTPFVFKTSLVLQMINDIDVYKNIMEHKCSEYTLYLGYLLKVNLFYDNYIEHNFMCKIVNNSAVKNNKVDLEILLSEAFLLNDEQVFTIIQSRCNVHNQCIDTLNMYIDTSYKKQKIAMLTIVDKNYYNRYKEALFIKRDYCKYHNYDFIIKIIDKCSGWDKIYLLKEHLHKYDYVFMSDGDVVITNRDITIEELLIKYGEPELFMISEDYNSLNSGNMIWANSDMSHKFINDMISLSTTKINELQSNPYKIIGVYEQPYLINLINTTYLKNITLIPQYEINSYIYNHDDSKSKSKWENGNFLVHFAGLNKQFKNLDKYIKMFCNIYKINIIQKEGIDYGSIK